MRVAAPSPRPAARPRRAAAFALAALAFVLAFLGATTDRGAVAHVAIHRSTREITRSAAGAPARSHRDPQARFGSDGPDEEADLGGRAPTPTSAVRSRTDRGGVGPLPELVSVAVAARCLAPAATAALLDGASGARIAALHERAREITPAREPNPARGPPLS